MNLALPALRGVQAGRPYYAVMVTVEQVITLFAPVDANAPPEERAQRALAKARVGPIADYVLSNPASYVFASLVGAVDGEGAYFQQTPKQEGTAFGLVVLNTGTRVHLLDGQHRRAGLEEAKRRVGEATARAAFLGEDLTVLLYPDPGLKRARQMFADLNGTGVRPNASLAKLFDQRDEAAELARAVVKRVPVFAALTDGEKTSASGQSKKLFAFKSLYLAAKTVAEGIEGSPAEVRDAVVLYFDALAAVVPGWGAAAAGLAEYEPSSLRADFVHAHQVTLQALGLLGKGLLANHKADWPSKVALLVTKIDWRREAKVWEGRCCLAGKMVINQAAIQLTENVLRAKLGMPLSVAGRAAEKKAFGRETLKG